MSELESELEELIEEWRNHARTHREVPHGERSQANAFSNCADDLENALGCSNE